MPWDVIHLKIACGLKMRCRTKEQLSEHSYRGIANGKDQLHRGLHSLIQLAKTCQAHVILVSAFACDL